MPLKAYLPFAFSNTHENVMFDVLVEMLTEQCAGQTETSHLIGNFSVEGEELDALFLKGNNICVVELKHIGGAIRFSEMGPWTADGNEFQCVKGNPLRQVKGYIYTVLNYLKKHQNRFLKTTAQDAFPFIHGAVVFGKKFEMQNHGPSKLDNWFHVCDVAGAARKLASLQDWNHCFQPDELEQLVQVFDVSDRFLYRQGTAGAAPTAAPKPEKRFRRFKIVCNKDTPFLDSRDRMSKAGAAKSQGVVRLDALMAQVRQGINAFSVIPFRVDSRIANSAIYTINEQCELAGIKSEETFYPFFIGDQEEVESWVAANEGLVLTVGGATKRIGTTVVLPDQAEPVLQPSAPTVENVPLLQRITGLDLSSLVPAAFIRKALEHLDENSTDAEILEVLESVPVEDVRKFLLDVINLVRAGDLQGAETRISIRNGSVVPIVDAASVESEALASDENSDQIVVINDLDDRQMMQLLDPKHFQQWMLFLHKDQKRVAEADFDRPVVLTGVSGSGKTCILVYRARYLANKYPGERIAVMSLNRALADLLRNLVRQLCTPEESARIEVMAFYDYFSRLLHSLGPDRYLEQLQSLAPEDEMLKRAIAQADKKKLANEIDTRSGETSEETWDDFYDQKNEAVRGVFQDVVQSLEARRLDACRYLREECTLIRSALTLGERKKYENGEEFKREGRAIPFLPSMRRDVLKILLQFEEWMLQGALLDVVELTQAVTPLWQEIRKLAPEHRFRCLLVDEFQDFSTLDLRLLVHVPTTQENGLFLAGDTVQKILVKRLNMTDAGLARGSATHRQIRKNYRNSRQILRAASKLANHYGTQANAQGEEIEILDPELATRATVPPIALKTDNPIRKAWEIAVDCLKQGSSTPWTVCIVTVAPDLISVQQILEQKPKGMRAELLTGDCINNPETLVVGTMQNLKGFEFTLVLLVGCEAGAIPSPGIPTEESWREALRLYVAMTRARDQVYLIYQDQPSEFLKIMSGEIIQKEEQAAMNYEVEPRPIPVTPVTAPVLNTHVTSPVTFEPELDAEESCESEFDKAESELLHAYFAQHVYGKPYAPCDTFREWMKPKHLRTINFGLLAMNARRNKIAFQSLRHKFIRLRLS